MIARHGIPFVRNSIAASVNGKNVSKDKRVTDYRDTRFLTVKCNCNITSYAPTEDKILEFTSTSSDAEYDKIGTPSYLVTTSLFITLGENVGDLWLETLLMNCYFRLETLTLNGNEEVLL